MMPLSTSIFNKASLFGAARERFDHNASDTIDTVEVRGIPD
jgi:hypothetical protein